MTHILIAEDEAFIANLYKLNLEQAGMKVTVVHDGNKAIEALKKGTFHAFLLDILMPGTDGFAVLEWIKGEGKAKRVPTIVLTNLSQKPNQKKCEQLGAVDYIVKSNEEAEEVVKMVKKHLKR